MPPVPTPKVPLPALVMTDSTVMVFHVITSMNVPEVLTTVTLMPTASIPWADLNVNAKMVSKVMDFLAEISTNVSLTTHATAPLPAVILKVVSNVLAKLVSPVMVSTVPMSMNALPVITHVMPMPHALTPPVVSHAHVTLDSKVTVSSALISTNVPQEEITVTAMPDVSIL